MIDLGNAWLANLKDLQPRPTANTIVVRTTILDRHVSDACGKRSVGQVTTVSEWK